MKKIILIIIMLSLSIIMSSLGLGQCPSEMISYWDFNDDIGEITSSQVGLWNGLQGLWHLNGNANAAKGNVHGTITKATSSSTGIFKQSYYFNGVDAVIDFGNNFNYGVTSISFWAKHDKDDQYRTVVSKRGCCNNANDFQWTFQLNNNKRLTFGIVTTSGNTFWVGGPLMDNQWHHYVGTYDGNIMRLYVDGVQVGSNSNPSGNIKFQNRNMRIGYNHATQTDNRFQGNVDELGIWNRALSASEVSQLYNLRFARDSKSNSHGIVVDAVPTTGKVGKGLNFNGVNNEVTVNSVLSKLSNTQGTLTAWAYPIGTGSNRYVYDSNFNQRTYIQHSGGHFNVCKGDPGVCIRLISNAPLNQWYHLTLSWHNGLMKGYINGELVESRNFVGSGQGTRARIGSQGLDRTFQGRIDEVAFYNRALTDGEIRTIYYASNSKNLNYCSNFKPIATSFGGTNINTIPDLTQAQNFQLTKEQGSVKWNNNVTLVGENLDSNINLGYNFISLNKNNLHSTLDSEANITFMVDGCHNLRIYYVGSGFYDNLNDIKANGVICPEHICSEIRCDGNTLTFTAAHFDGFGGEGDPVGDPVIPEFNLMGIILVIIIASTGLYFISKRK